MNWLLVGFGSFLGGLARYGLLQLPLARYGVSAVMAANLIGSFLIGCLAAWFAKDHPSRIFWGLGVMGGFTTFSSFSLELLDQLQNGQSASALLNASIQVFGGLLLCFIGYSLASRLGPGGTREWIKKRHFWQTTVETSMRTAPQWV